MKYMFVAPNITVPTMDTVREVVGVSFQKVEDFLKKLNLINVTIKISVEKIGRSYQVKVEILDFPRENPFIRVEDYNLRRAISESANKIKQVIKQKKELL